MIWDKPAHKTWLPGRMMTVETGFPPGMLKRVQSAKLVKGMEPVKSGHLYVIGTMDELSSFIRISEPFIDSVLFAGAEKISDLTRLQGHIKLYERYYDTCLTFVDLLILWGVSKANDADMRVIRSTLFQRAQEDKATVIDVYTEDMERACEVYSFVHSKE